MSRALWIFVRVQRLKLPHATIYDAIWLAQQNNMLFASHLYIYTESSPSSALYIICIRDVLLQKTIASSWRFIFIATRAYCCDCWLLIVCVRGNERNIDMCNLRTYLYIMLYVYYNIYNMQQLTTLMRRIIMIIIYLIIKRRKQILRNSREHLHCIEYYEK